MNLIFRQTPIFAFVLVIFILGISFGAVAVKTVDYSTKEDVFSYFNGFLQGSERLNTGRQFCWLTV